MSTHEETQGGVPPSATVITRRTAEIVTGIVVAVFALLAIVSNYQIGAGWAEDGPQAGYFPMRMGIAILLASIVVVVQAVRKNDRSAFLEQAQFKLVAIVLLPLALYVSAVQFIGIYVASMLFIGIFMWLVGKFSWVRSAITGVSVSLVLFWIFEIMFTVPLPKGPLEQLFGY